MCTMWPPVTKLAAFANSRAGGEVTHQYQLLPSCAGRSTFLPMALEGKALAYL